MEKIPRMLRLIILCFFLSSLFACKPETPAEGESATKTRPITPPEGGPIIGANKQPSMQTEQLFKYLSTGYWYVEAYVKINDRESALENRGRWYRFSPEGTFESGKFLTASSKGSWTYDPQNALIFIDSQNDLEDGEWKLQMGKSGTVMIWVGTTRFLQNSIQLKLENYLELMAELPAPGN